MKYDSIKELLPVNVRKGKPAFALQRPDDGMLLSNKLTRFVGNAESAIVFNTFDNALKFAAKFQEQIRHDEFLDDLHSSDELVLRQSDSLQYPNRRN